MAVQSAVTEKIYWPGSTMAWEPLAGLVFLDSAELIVEAWSNGAASGTVLARDVHYALSGDGATGGASIRALAAWPDDVVFHIRREGLPLQLVSLAAHMPLKAKDLERALDRATLRLQELDREGRRALQVPRGEGGLVLPGLAARAEKYLKFAPDGAPSLDDPDNFAAPARSAEALAEAFSIAMATIFAGYKADNLADGQADPDIPVGGVFLVIEPDSGRIYWGQKGATEATRVAEFLTRGAIQAPSRAILAQLDPALADAVTLSEAGREGQFRFDAGNCSGIVGADPRQGLTVPPASDPSGASGAWRRIWDGATGRPEWFGAVLGANSPDARADNKAGIEACIALCPITQLSAGDYWTQDTINIDVPYRTVRGVTMSDGYGYSDGRPTGTRILCVDGTKDVVRVGPADPPSGGINFFHRGIMVSDICARWVADQFPPSPGSEAAAVKAFRIQYLLSPELYRCVAWEPMIGFYLHGVINPMFWRCSASRYEGAYGPNDFFRGYWLRGDPPVVAGGNGSVYMFGCNVSTSGNGLVHSIGWFCNGNFADTYLLQCETSQVNQPVVFDGGGFVGGGAHLDVHIIMPVFDQCGLIGVDLVNLNEAATITLSGGYIQMRGGAEKAVWARGGGGSVVLTGGLQLLCSDGGATGGCFGVRGSNQPHLIIDKSVTIKEAAYPVSLDGGCKGGVIEPTIFLSTRPGGSRDDAVFLADCSNMQIAPSVRARAGAPSFEHGVRLGGTGNSRILIDATRIEASAASTPVQVNGVAIAAPGVLKSDGSAGAHADKGVTVMGYVG